MYVRDLNYSVDLDRVTPLLEESPFIKSEKYNYGMISVFPLVEAYETVKKVINKSPYYLAEKVVNI